MATDAAIQQLVRDEFASSTMLIVAHRLSTIVDCDRIMVLGDGRLLEYDDPVTLLGPKSETSQFSSMVATLGEEEAAKLREKLKVSRASPSGACACESVSE